MYALSVMSTEGSVHGYGLAQRIAARTEGAWHPGPGAIYPALNRLVERGLAQVDRQGTRRVYRLTSKGGALLRRFADRVGGSRQSLPDTSALWMEIVGETDRGQYLLGHVRRHLEQTAQYAERIAGTREGNALRENLLHEVRAFEARLRQLPTRRTAPKGRAGGRPA
jgi:DNA-binding PadR family transcriptional regulator